MTTPVLTNEQVIFDLHEASDVDPSVYIERAVTIAQNFLGRNLYGAAEDLDTSVDPIGLVADAAVRAGVSLIVANLWTHRGDDVRGSTGNLLTDSGADFILWPYRLGVGV